MASHYKLWASPSRGRDNSWHRNLNRFNDSGTSCWRNLFAESCFLYRQVVWLDQGEPVWKFSSTYSFFVVFVFAAWKESLQPWDNGWLEAICIHLSVWGRSTVIIWWYKAICLFIKPPKSIFPKVLYYGSKLLINLIGFRGEKFHGLLKRTTHPAMEVYFTRKWQNVCSYFQCTWRKQ